MVNSMHYNYQYASEHWIQLAEYRVQLRARSNGATAPRMGEALLDHLRDHGLIKDVLCGLNSSFVTGAQPEYFRRGGGGELTLGLYIIFVSLYYKNRVVSTTKHCLQLHLYRYEYDLIF
jgi:hypothetical protein